jgi:pyrimidine-nucleoside phosphorylase
MKYQVTDIIRRKRDGNTLGRDEIDFLIREYTQGRIPDYQMSAFLMAVYFQGLDFRETTDLTNAMLRSGEVLDLTDIKASKIDKHSTGGVGDKTSLVVAPLIASCGVCVPMISGRGLGHTGGTLDKLESIPDVRTNLSMGEVKKQLKEIDVAMIGQTAEIAPADKKMYALRDVTATVDSIPLIAASIMSKKRAEGLDGLVLDVKYGNGAFMSDFNKAEKLAEAMIQIGKQSRIKVVALLTDMNNPLGEYIGNSVEIIEAIETLKGNGPSDVVEVSIALGELMLEIARKRGGRKLLEQNIANGKALDTFKKIIAYQGGDIRVIEDYERLPVAQHSIEITAPRSGYIHSIDTYRIGMLLVKLGGGRLTMEDTIDRACGFKIQKKTGDGVKKGETLIEILCDDEEKTRAVARDMEKVFTIHTRPCRHKRLIREIMY